MKRLISIVLLGATLTMGVAACGSDSKKSPTTAAVTTIAPANSTAGPTATTAAAGTPSASAEVQAFCTSADTLAAKLKAAAKDPQKLADLSKDATDFATKAAQLSGANASESAAIQACAQKVATAYTG